MGRNDISTLVPGKAADLTLLDWSSLSYAGGRNDPAECNVLSGDARMVDTVIVNGEIVVEKGRLLRMTNGRKAHMLIRLVMNYFRGLLSTFPPFKKKSFRLYRNLQEGRYERKKLAY